MINNLALDKEKNLEFALAQNLEAEFLLDKFQSISDLYPNFEGWLRFRFLGNIKSGSRKLLVAYKGNEIVGYSLLKQDSLESKICTFYIPEMYRGQGIGSALMEESLDTLKSKDTFITVSQERQDELAPLLVAKGFSVHSEVNEMYRHNSKEYIWNLRK